MKPIPVLGIPHLVRPDLLLRCVKSIDYPVDKLVVTQNGKDEDFPQDLKQHTPACVKEFIHIKHPNAGVAGSWNEVIMLCPAEWWLLSNQDIQFAPGDLEKMANAAWENHERVSILCAKDFGHALFVHTKRGVTMLGLYDHSFYPAYLEDCEMMWRLGCMGEAWIDVPGIKATHGEDVNGVMHGSRTINSSDKLAAENSRTHGNGYSYYAEKTGGMPGQEKFKHPFNNQNLPFNCLAFDPVRRAMNQWKI